RIIVGPEEELYSEGLLAMDCQWISDPGPLRQKVQVKIRYQSPPFSATAENLGGKRIKVSFDRPQKAVTPGQIAVLYQGEEVLGGGTIHEPLGNH
ncbi:MAG: aminomethyltransferase beta-barrel domain-containing protein, partial [Candidatus Acetothermia bacterium]